MPRRKRFDTMRPPSKPNRPEGGFDTMAPDGDPNAVDGGEPSAPEPRPEDDARDERRESDPGV